MKAKQLKYIIAVAFTCLLVTGGKLFAQQLTDNTITNNTDPLVYNPAYAGSHVQLSATAMYRAQWVNFPGAPETSTFSAHTSLLKDKIGVGILFINDKIGSYSNDNLYLSYAYKIKFPLGGTFAMGLQAGFNGISADYSDLNLVDDDPEFVNFNRIRPNFGAGVRYYNDRVYAGLSVPYLLNNDLTDGVNDIQTEVREARYYILDGGVTLPINRFETVFFAPSALIRLQEGQPVTAQLIAAFIINDRIKMGMSYRTGDAFSPFFDLKITENFHFAYSYDWTTSDIADFSNGTHQFMVNYRVRIRGIHRNIECPSIYNH